MLQAQQPELLVVACAMKSKRQVDLCKQALVYMTPLQGVMFCPIDPAARHVHLDYDALLLKATDYLAESLDDSGNITVQFQPSLYQVNILILLFSIPLLELQHTSISQVSAMRQNMYTTSLWPHAVGGTKSRRWKACARQP
jgi:hypothetical protein